MNDTVSTPQEPADAYAVVKNAVDKLRAELSDTGHRITLLESEIEALPKMRVPFEDLKAGLIDLYEVAGRRYAAGVFRGAIVAHATGRNYLHAIGQREIGKPITLGRLVEAIEVGNASDPETVPRFLVNGNAHGLDGLIGALFMDTARAALLEAMRDITPEEFGYSSIDAAEIGPTRVEMARMIDERKAEIEVLKAKEAGLVQKLVQLGITIRYSNGRPEVPSGAR